MTKAKAKAAPAKETRYGVVQAFRDIDTHRMYEAGEVVTFEAKRLQKLLALGLIKPTP